MWSLYILAWLWLGQGGLGPQFRKSEQILLDELNDLRADPRTYARRLEARRSQYHGLLLRIPGYVPVETREGVRALDEAIRDLRAQAPLPLVDHAPALTRAALDQIRDLGTSGAATHMGRDGSGPMQRMQRYAPGIRVAGEVLTFGSVTPQDAMLDLLTDDGVANRGHRKLLLDRRYRVAGAACGPHREFHTICAIELADSAGSGR